MSSVDRGKSVGMCNESLSGILENGLNDYHQVTTNETEKIRSVTSVFLLTDAGSVAMKQHKFPSVYQA